MPACRSCYGRSVSAAIPGSLLEVPATPAARRNEGHLVAESACLTAVTESPPPMIVVAFDFAARFRNRDRSGRERRNLNTPTEQFHKIIFALAISSSKRLIVVSDIDGLPACRDSVRRRNPPVFRPADPGSTFWVSVIHEGGTRLCFASSKARGRDRACLLNGWRRRHALHGKTCSPSRRRSKWCRPFHRLDDADLIDTFEPRGSLRRLAGDSSWDRCWISFSA